MDEATINLLLNAAKEVLENTGLGVTSVRKASGSPPSVAVVAVVGLVGDISGTLLISLNEQTAVAIVRAMYRSMGLTATGEMKQEPRDAAIAEFANQVAGRTVTLLSKESTICDLTPPAVFSGDQVAASLPSVATMESRVLEGGFGEVALSLGMEKRRKNREDGGF